MSSKIPRLSSPAGAAKTDDEKLANLFKGARPKQRVEQFENMKTNGNLEPTKKKNIQNEKSEFMKNKNKLPSGMAIPKTTTNKNAADFPKKENSMKGCVKDQSRKTRPEKPHAKPENSRKTEFKSNKTNKSDMPSQFAGLVLTPKIRRSYKPPFDLGQSRRRSLSAPGNPSEKENDKKNNQIVKTNKSKTINQTDLETTNMSPEFSDFMKSDMAQNTVAQEEFLVKNKNELPSGMTISKTATTNKNIVDFPKKQSSKKGCVKAHETVKTLKLSENRSSSKSVQEKTQKQLSVKNTKPENSRKTEFKNNKTSNNFNKYSEFFGLVSIPKVHQSNQSPLDLSKSRRRSLSAPGKPTEKRKNKINDNQIAHTNISKTINRRDLEMPYVMSAEFSNSMKCKVAQNKLAEEEFSASKKNLPHGGIEFRPNLRKRKSIFNFNLNKT